MVDLEFLVSRTKPDYLFCHITSPAKKFKLDKFFIKNFLFIFTISEHFVRSRISFIKELPFLSFFRTYTVSVIEAVDCYSALSKHKSVKDVKESEKI